MNVREIGCKNRTGLIWLKTGIVGSCEHSSEPTGSIKCGTFCTSSRPGSSSRRTLLHRVSYVMSCAELFLLWSFDWVTAQWSSVIHRAEQYRQEFEFLLTNSIFYPVGM